MPPWLAVVALMALLRPAPATLDDFYFSRHPENLVVREGGSVDLECMVSNTSFIRFYWQLDGDMVMNTSRRFQRGSDLHIARVDRRLDGGHFTCIAMNVTTGFSLTSLAASLNIQWMDPSTRVQLQSPSSPAAIVPGSDVTLRCRADGSGDVTYQWFRNGVRLTRAPRRALRNKRLQLSAVRPADNGVYSCRAANAAGSAHSDVTFPLIVPGPDAPQVTTVPRDQLVRRGTTATFRCHYRNAETTEWFLGDRGPLTSSGKYTVLSNGTLLVSDVSEADVGWYHCVGRQSANEANPQTYSAQLILAYLEPLTARSVEPPPPLPQLYVVPAGRPFQLSCLPPEGRPPTAVWWEAPDGAVLGKPRKEPAVLSLDLARQSHSGNYSCVAENLSGTSSLQVQVLVTAPPELAAGPSNVITEEGRPAELSCLFRDLQRRFATVTWMKDGQPVSTPSKVTEDSDTLVIPVSELSDAGQYQCVVNATGFQPVVSPEATLTVREKLKFSPRPVSQALELDKPGRLHCRAAGSSKPTVGWVRILPSGRPQFEWPPHVTDVNGTLQFNPVRESDGGEYSCVATNAQGFINATVNLTVVVTPKFLTPARTPLEAVVGRSVLIDCQVYGRPEPSVQWDKDSKLTGLDDSRVVVLKNGSLYIKELRYEDEARYGCIAGNSGGFSRQETQLLVRSSESDLTQRAMTPGVASDDGGLMTRTVLITVSAAAAYLVLVAGLMAWCRYRRIKRKQQYLRTAAEGTSVLLDKTDGGGSSGGGGGCPRARYIQYPGDLAPSDSASCGYHSPSVQTAGYHSYQSIRSDCEAPPSCGRTSAAGASDRSRPERHQLQPVMPLGHGDFGEVYLARVKRRKRSERGGTSDSDHPIVMVKTLQNRQPHLETEFAREAELHGLVPGHRAVAALLAHCHEQLPHLMVVEYTDWGDLKQFLLATRPDSSRGGPRPPPLSAAQATSVCHQVAAGLAHIHSHGFIHRDVATRNCLITSGLGVKLSCGRLSHDTYSAEYCLLRGRRLPLRWLPAEAVLRDQMTSRADCWAWAVLCWEVLRRAELPHAGLSDEQLARAGPPPLSVPAEAPVHLAAAMHRCWAPAVADRPDMGHVLDMLSGPPDGEP
ncbi:inactive tyrosine-protein kinase 7-like [Amphibalanus amphitrite]|uniref:inactive tyrosine-protein kinase 7-like n=1 Tax=Amphibalanus amphitrite TaxID=1232801 RepID=UPI001C928FB0|nr:inactive tyrosine-protein kinase 7-like [Amphibalanus amphitrite]